MKNKKRFTIIKVGYRSGVYGLIAEYFTAILFNGESGKHTSFNFYGIYGTEGRVEDALQELGWENFWTPSGYGKMVHKDTMGFWDESKTLKYIEENKEHLTK